VKIYRPVLRLESLRYKGKRILGVKEYGGGGGGQSMLHNGICLQYFLGFEKGRFVKSS